MRTLILMAALMAALAAGAQQTDDFPYPTVPDTLRTPDTRALYVMQHYWDRFDFANTTKAYRTETIEQGFANFVDLMPRVAPATAAAGIQAFVNHLYSIEENKGEGNMREKADNVREYFATLTEKYLADTDSPLHNDMLYAQFLDVMAANKFATIAERTRNGYMARNLRKNLPGSTAADFDYADRNGTHHRMHDFKAQYTLLYFYDPDCAHCRETAGQIADMEKTALATQQNGSKGVRVLAIYPYSDTETWKAAKQHFPESWTDGYSPYGQITTDDTYYIKSVPSVYLLDSNKKVLLKNPSMKLLEETLRKL